MSEHCLYFDRNLPRVKRMSLQDFTSLFGADPVSWQALNFAVFTLEKPVKFLRPDGQPAWLAPFSPHLDGTDGRGLTYNAYDFEEHPRTAALRRIGEQLPMVVDADGPEREFRVSFTCKPEIYAQTSVRARSRRGALNEVVNNFGRYVSDLQETAENAFRSWLPHRSEFTAGEVEEVD